MFSIKSKFIPCHDVVFSMMFAEFFSIKNNSEAERFENKYKQTELGVKLMQNYAKVSFNEEALRAFAKEPYFTEKDMERVLIKRALNNFPDEFSIDSLAKLFGLPISEVQRIAE
jgi:hypothetical protein